MIEFKESKFYKLLQDFFINNELLYDLNNQVSNNTDDIETIKEKLGIKS